MIQNSGTQFFTAAGVVGASGKAVRVFSIVVVSDGTAGVTTVRNGTSSGGTAYDIITGTVSTGAIRYYGTQGVVFAAGCYIDADAHSVGVTVSFNYLS